MKSSALAWRWQWAHYGAMQEVAIDPVERARQLVQAARMLRAEARQLRRALLAQRQTLRRERARLREDPKVFARLKDAWYRQRGK